MLDLVLFVVVVVHGFLLYRFESLVMHMLQSCICLHMERMSYDDMTLLLLFYLSMFVVVLSIHNMFVFNMFIVVLSFVVLVFL